MLQPPRGPWLSARRAALGTVAVSVAVVGLPAVASAALPATPFISEIHYDDAGADAGEQIEVHLPAGTSTAGWTIALYNGSNGTVYGGTLGVPAATAPADAPAVVVVSAPGLQNGAPDGLALVDASGDLVEFLSYEGSLTAVGGPADGETSTDIGVAESGEPEGQSLQRLYDPAADEVFWDGPAPHSFGTVNPAAPPVGDQCAIAPTHRIGEVQGSGFSTPLSGTRVTVQGVVVGDVPGLGGFYLQDRDGDGDPATSDGVFVASNAPVDLGDRVAVSGTPAENFGETQIPARRYVSVCTGGGTADLPAAAPLDLPAPAADRERLEGMLVAPADTLTVSEVFALTRFGELTLSEGGLLVQPTELARPGSPEAAAVAQDNTRRRLVLDDGSNASRSATDRPYLSPGTPVRVGDQLTFTAPVVLGFGFGEWRLQPADGSAEGTFAGQDTRPAGPGAVGGDVRIGAFNVLNYFLTFGDSDIARGAENAEDFERQAAKIVTAIEALDADVVTLMEIEDTDSTGYTDGNADSALADLVERLNTSAGSDVWGYVPLPQELYDVDRDVIRNGIIYRTDVVQPVGDPVGLVEEGEETVWDNAREPIAQTFVKDGDAFTVVANHFKSKSPGEPTGDNVDSGDGQGEWNGDRRRQAASLADFADALRESTGDDDVVLLGDFNAYSQEDPIVDLAALGYGDLGTEHDPGRYSYVFDDMSGSLDHALATEALADKVTGLVHWNINAVESFAYQYTGDPALYSVDPYRSSDHDPLLFGLDLTESCAGLAPTLVGTDGDDVLTGTNKQDVIMGLGGDDVLRGGNAEDVICGGAGDDTLAGANGAPVLLGGFGDDTLFGNNGADRLVGGPGADELDQGRGQGSEEQEGAES